VLTSEYPFGYNLKSGNGRGNISEETRRKMSYAQSGESNPMFGKTGDEHWGFGKRRTLKTRRKISHSLRGRKLPDSVRNKISENSSNKKIYHFISPVEKTTEITNLAKFCRDHKLCERSMRKVVSGKYTHHRGWRLEK
jgi:hypothetical protein